MIIIAIGDGLGNQMFQYAFYYAMKEHYKQSTVLFDKEFVSKFISISDVA